MSKDSRTPLKLLAEEVAEKAATLYKGIDKKRFLELLENPGNEEYLRELLAKLTEVGVIVVKENDAGGSSVSRQQAEAVGVGAFKSMLSNAASKWSLRITAIKAGIWLGGTAVLLVLAFFLIRSLVPFIMDELTDQAPKLRDTAPEWYCAMTYRINDTVRYSYCDQVHGVKE